MKKNIDFGGLEACLLEMKNNNGDAMHTDEEGDVIDRANVVDEAVDSDGHSNVLYAITSFGSDPEVEVLVKRLNRGEIYIPPFQREYIWNIKEASRFIESLLLGLPVPGIFLARDEETNKQLVIDGQQRLKTLQFFFSGFFNPKEGDRRQRVFELSDVQEPFDGKTYKTLSEKDRLQLETAIIHATIIKQDTPANDDTSIYHIFERLNSGGRRLAPQEIRVVAYHGELIALLKRLNKISAWRDIYGAESPRLKDQELILRYLALLEGHRKYEKPMKEFLSKFSKANRNGPPKTLAKWERMFSDTIVAIRDAIGDKAFRPERSLNAAVFDSVMVGVSLRLAQSKPLSAQGLKDAYDKLMVSETFSAATSSGTSAKKNVEDRMEEAIRAFSVAP